MALISYNNFDKFSALKSLLNFFFIPLFLRKLQYLIQLLKFFIIFYHFYYFHHFFNFNHFYYFLFSI
jgi:hypothetical protein